nr:MAG: ORF1 [Torque teno midi virus]
MPFWWQRRNRWWRGRRRQFYKRKRTHKRRRPRRRFYKRRHRRTYRRGRRRLKKVRRKRKTLPLKQWQPETIRKCKIKGIAVNTLGVQGTQYRCYTPNKYEYTIAKQPAGGSIGVERYTLEYLYKEHKAGNNIWTASNVNLDLVRYTGCTFKFLRHPHIDFVGYYSRNYPMQLQKYTYADTHPQQVMLAKHKFYIPSLLTKPTGKRYVKVKMKPPTQMSNKWFFQEGFADTGLIQLHTAAADLRYPHLGCCNTNQLASFLTLNTDFYQYAAWGNNHNPYIPTEQNKWYRPYRMATVITKVKNVKDQNIDIQTTFSPYEDTISYQKGWFQPKLLQAKSIVEPAQANPPLKGARYNPTLDTGENTAVWLTSVLNQSYYPPKTDLDLYIEGLPLWQLMLGFLDWVKQKKKDPTFLQSYYLCFHCDAIEPKPGLHQVFIPVDYNFVQGKGPYDSILSDWDTKHWYPLLKHQLETINSIVSTGPFMPKLDTLKNSTWELYSLYTFYFKFGGASLPEAETKDPATQGTHEVPDKQSKTIQIINPQKNTAAAALHCWDFRRGHITSAAFKRMCENAETDSDFAADVPKKKKKTTLQENTLPCISKEAQEVQDCLHSLYEESTCQEIPQDQDLQQLIYQQQQQQQQTKLQLLQLINNLKKKQKLIQLQTGILD